MLEIADNGKTAIKKIFEFAVDNDCLENFLEQLQYLTTYGRNDTKDSTKCILYHDFAPFSMEFQMLNYTSHGWDVWFNGGLIYSGPGVPSNGRAPSLTVSNDRDAAQGETHQWSVHT